MQEMWGGGRYFLEEDTSLWAQDKDQDLCEQDALSGPKTSFTIQSQNLSELCTFAE